MAAQKPVSTAKATISPVGPKRESAVAPSFTQTEDGETVYAYDPDEVTEESEEDGFTYQPSDKIPAGEIIYVRNNTRSIVRFVDHPKSEVAKFNVAFDPAGQPGSVISLETYTVLRNPGFQRWWKAGKLTVSNENLPVRSIDISEIEIERQQQIALEGTLLRTAPGSLPLPKDLDMSFLDEQNPASPKFRG